MSLNRIVALATAACGLAGALAVPLANLDTQSTAGLIAGMAVVLGAAAKWLDGWQKHEERQFYGADALTPTSPEEEGDSEQHPAVADIPVPEDIPPDEGDPGQPEAEPESPARPKRKPPAKKPATGTAASAAVKKRAAKR